MIRLRLLLLSAAAVASADPVLELLHGVESLYRINTHNANRHRSYNMTYYDDLSALTPEQFKKRLGFRLPSVLPDTSSYKVNENFKAPDSVDWRTEGIVSPVKNQEDCGSCWAFSAVGAFEGQHAKMRGELVQFSEQFLVDCSTEIGNSGCGGGIVDLAFLYVKLKGGIETEEAYPYKGNDGTCEFNVSAIGEKAWGLVDLPSGEEFLKNAVAEIGPISVAVQVADDNSFRDYKEGVYYNPNCGTEFSDLNHAVLVVGYGTDPEHGDYWLVKNSWKSTWGENGYIRMARNRKNNCGIASLASYPILE